MKLIIPMAGRGTRLRPHSLSLPKPLLPVAGPMLIERMVNSFVTNLDREITEIAFVLGDFGHEVQEMLAGMARSFGAKPVFYRQTEALGTAHAVNCAAPSLHGEVIVAFADTLFTLENGINLDEADCVVWLKKVANPSQYGVAVLKNNQISHFVEKPREPVSDMAIIGVYYFRQGERLQKELQNLIVKDIRGHKNEYDLTDAIELLLEKSSVFRPAGVRDWLDFGNISSWISSTALVLDQIEPQQIEPDRFPGTRIIPPCHIGSNVQISDSTIGPYATIGNACSISKSEISNSIVLDNALIRGSRLNHSTVGRYTEIHSCSQEIHVGDFSKVGQSR